MRRTATALVMVLVAALGGACVPPDGPGDPGGTDTCGSFREVWLQLDGQQGYGASMTRGGRLVAFFTDDRRVALLDTTTEEVAEVSVALPPGWIQRLQISSDGERIAAVTRDGQAVPRAVVVDVATGGTTELDWSAVDWPDYTSFWGFSGDLSVGVSTRHGSEDLRLIPSDGTAPITFMLPGSASRGPIDETGGTIARGTSVWRGGELHTYPGPSDGWTWATDIDRFGARVIMVSSAGPYFWYVATGEVEAIEPPAGWTAIAGPTVASQSGRFVVRDAVLDGDWGTWWTDRLHGTSVRLPISTDGPTRVSDDGRVITSTSSVVLICDS